VAAYVVFYYSYIPLRGFSQTVHLQFEQGRNPYANLKLPSGQLVAGQPYNVNAHMHLPRTPSNTAAGNFMIDLQLLGPPATASTEESPALLSERRPAILTYRSPVMEYAHNIMFLPLHVIGWCKESENLVVPLLDHVVFPRDRKSVPSRAKIEIQSPYNLQVYSMKLEFRAQLRGLRYVANIDLLVFPARHPC
jgi:seipin